jgi:hypothetical protein
MLSFKLRVIGRHYNHTEKRGVEETTGMKFSRRVISCLLHDMTIFEFNVCISHSVAVS